MRGFDLFLLLRRGAAAQAALDARLAEAAAAAVAGAPVSDREARLVDDMARHVTAKVAPIVQMHGRTLETAEQACTMALEVAVRLGLEAAQNAALGCLARGRGQAEALRLLDDTLQLLCGGLAAHRDDLARNVEAAAAGMAGGQVRQGDAS